MLKRFEREEDTVIVGDTKEIRRVYNKLWDRYDEFTPACLSYPRFVEGRRYGIIIDAECVFTLVNEHTLVGILADMVA